MKLTKYPWDDYDHYIDYVDETGDDNYQGQSVLLLRDKLKPSDFYFSVGENEWDGIAFVAICPKSQFDREGHQYDQHIDWWLEKILPKGYFESMEGVFEPEDETLTVEQIHNKLLKLGFIQSEKFDKFMLEHQ